MGRSNVERARDLADALDRYWGAIDLAGNAVAAVVDAHGGSGAAAISLKLWSKKAKAALPKSVNVSPEIARKALERKLAEQKVAVVVLIDELDRIEDDEVRAVAQLVKAVGEIEGLSYLVAYDADRVTEALGRGEGDVRKMSGAHYLEKIIQLPIPLRPLFTEDVEALIRAEIDYHDVTLPEDLSNDERDLFDQIKREISTPRDVKRLVGAFAILQQATRGEISDIDVLAYAWITIKAPALREKLAIDYDKVVIDPGTHEMFERSKQQIEGQRPGPDEILGAPAKHHIQLLSLLFPRFAKRYTIRNDDSTRLYNRRNLVRLLYLGNPPGAVRRAEVEAIWNEVNPQKLEKELRKIFVIGKLPEFLDRLDDLISQLPESGDTVFWPSLSKILTKSTDWIVQALPEQTLAKDAADTLIRLGIRDVGKIDRVKAAMEALISAGDLVIAPGVLRKHMFAHGLTHHGPARSGPTDYTKEETEDLIKREIPRYRAAIIDGTALRRLPNVEAIYVIGNYSAWDAELRENFTEQLQGREALTSIAALLVPPGFGSDLKSFNELFDVERVRQNLDQLDVSDPPLHPWVESAFKNFKAILLGTNSHFPDELEDGLLAVPSQAAGQPISPKDLPIEPHVH